MISSSRTLWERSALWGQRVPRSRRIILRKLWRSRNSHAHPCTAPSCNTGVHSQLTVLFQQILKVVVLTFRWASRGWVAKATDPRITTPNVRELWNVLRVRSPQQLLQSRSFLYRIPNCLLSLEPTVCSQFVSEIFFRFILHSMKRWKLFVL